MNYSKVSAIKNGSQFNVPTRIHWTNWENAIRFIPEHASRVLLITGHSSRARVEVLHESLSEKAEILVSQDVPSDPHTESVQCLVDMTRDFAPSWIIAIGGGSVLDSAKTSASLANCNGTVSEFLRGERNIEHPSLPLIAIPSTAGSGSEVTPFASITDQQIQAKRSLSHANLYPTHAILDPSLLLSVPPQQAAISGMDALSHAVEGFWSRYSTPVTEALGLSAARLIMSSFASSYRNQGDTQALDNMMQGSMLAGLTISHAMTTAIHSVSYPLTVFFGVPHGMACAMTLPSFIRYNDEAMESQKKMALLASIGIDSMDRFAHEVEALKSEIGLPMRLRDIGLTESDIPTIVENGFRPDRIGNNPRELDANSLTDLLTSIL